jgi:hypothetical protein
VDLKVSFVPTPQKCLSISQQIKEKNIYLIIKIPTAKVI